MKDQSPFAALVARADGAADQLRRDRMFPRFEPAEISRMRRFGRERRFAAGEELLRTGKPSPGMYVLMSGAVDVKRRDPLGRLAPITEMGAGEFVGEIGELSGGPSLVDVTAKSDTEALLVPTERIKRLLIAETELGDRILRALILRRVALIETGAGGPVLIGPELHPDVIRLQGFLSRNAYPHQVLDPEQDRDAANLISQSDATPEDLPLSVCPNGTVLKNPREAELARVLGMVRVDHPDRTYDVAIVGAGPGGLAAAVYAASEGLSVIVFDAIAFGGQAGASARIENYFGFPTGIPGQKLTGRGYVQAQKFGAELMIPTEVTALDASNTPLRLHLSDGRSMSARTAVIASGARYRKPDIPDIDAYIGHGIWYWASPVEARLCRREEVAVVGGGNSAGQAAVYLSKFARKVWMLVRGSSLTHSMSRYLIDRISAIEHIEVLTETEIVAVSGSRERQLERLRWRHKPSGAETEKDIRNVFLMIGADPATDWLKPTGVTLDSQQFIKTGLAPAGAGPPGEEAGRPLPLESNVLNVFAVGDVRSGSVKRVGGAIGEGAAVVAQLHTVLADAAHANRGR